MQHAAGFDAAALIRSGRDEVPVDIAARFGELLRERLTHRPLQHILGTTEFFGLEFLTDARALIPRPDSETVVEAALKRIPADSTMRVADLGTGSGCLLAAILANRPAVHGIGVEASQAAATLARENFERLGISPRAGVFEGSWADWPDWEDAGLVISNPPYIARGEISSLASEVRAHDPLTALDGGPDGLAAYREIISLAAERLRPGGWLVFEIGHDQKDAVCRLLRAADFSEIEAVGDLGGNDRAVSAQKPVS